MQVKVDTINEIPFSGNSLPIKISIKYAPSSGLVI